MERKADGEGGILTCFYFLAQSAELPVAQAVRDWNLIFRASLVSYPVNQKENLDRGGGR